MVMSLSGVCWLADFAGIGLLDVANVDNSKSSSRRKSNVPWRVLVDALDAALFSSPSVVFFGDDTDCKAVLTNCLSRAELISRENSLIGICCIAVEDIASCCELCGKTFEFVPVPSSPYMEPIDASRPNRDWASSSMRKSKGSLGTWGCPRCGCRW